MMVRDERRWQGAVQRVRQLMARLNGPAPRGLRIDRVESVSARLAPRLAVLDVSPFDALPPEPPPERSAASELVQRARRDWAVPLGPPPAAKAPAHHVDPAPARNVPVAPPAGEQRSPSPPILPVSASPAVSKRDRPRVNTTGTPPQRPETTAPALPVKTPPLAVSPGRSRRPTLRDVDADSAARASRVPVQLGQLAERALRAIEARAARRPARRQDEPARERDRDTAKSAIPPLPPPSAPPRRSEPPPTVAPQSLTAASTAITAIPDVRAAQDSGLSPGVSRVAGSAAPIQGVPSQRIGPRTGPGFVLDPFEARESLDDQDLADRIGDLLREQARRQGVDVT